MRTLPLCLLTTSLAACGTTESRPLPTVEDALGALEQGQAPCCAPETEETITLETRIEAEQCALLCHTPPLLASLCEQLL